MDNEFTYGLRPEQLTRLLAIGIMEPNTGDGAYDDKAVANLLGERFAGELSKDLFLVDFLSVSMARPSAEIRSLATKSLGEVLLAPESDVNLLKAIKNYNKKVCYSIASRVEKTAANTIYYAAIASSLVYHDKKITRHSYKVLERSCAALTRKKWMLPELVKLFSDARNICRDKKNRKCK